MIQIVRDGALGDAALVAAALAGDGGAFASLFDGWFDRCFDVAFRIVRNRDVAAEVAQEVFLAAWRDLASLRDHAAFGGWVLRASRNRALNRLEKERRSVALGDEATTTAVDAAAAAPDASTGALSGTGAQLLWAATAALGERDASILDLHLRHGLAAPELAEALGVTANNAHQLLFRLKARLGDAIRSFVLWHDGRPSCPELEDVLHRAGLAAFGADAAKLAQRHAATCERCGERQRLALAPEVLFAGVPLVLAGPALRTKVISALRAEGVPVGEDPPVHLPAPDGPGTSGAPGVGVVEATEPQRGRRRGVLIALVLALLLVGGALLAQRKEQPEPLLDLPVLASVESLPSTTASTEAPGTSATTEVGATTAPPPGAATGPPRTATTATTRTTSTTAATTTSIRATSTTTTITRPPPTTSVTVVIRPPVAP